MEQRGSERLAVDGTVVCRVGNAETRDALRDMSVRGCKLSGVGEGLVEGTRVDMTLLSGLTVSGTVRWVRDGEVGIEFDEDIGKATVRYFTLSALASRKDDVPYDSFGRKLPPLSQLEELADGERRTGPRADRR